MGICGTTFEPMPGPPMRDYVVLPDAIMKKPTELKAWARKALRYGGSLPAKKKSLPRPASRGRNPARD
jgi:hypothetical protein